MEKMTITEALSEVNLVKKKVEKKSLNVLQNLIRAKHLKDPFEADGGSKKVNESEVQAIDDLNSRLIKLRAAISRANLDNSIAIDKTKMSIHDWLIWKREVSKSASEFAQKIPQLVKTHIDQVTRQPQVYKDSEEKTHLVDYEINIDYPGFIKRSERISDSLEKLDGQLSLKNATIVVEI